MSRIIERDWKPVRGNTYKEAGQETGLTPEEEALLPALLAKLKREGGE